MILNAFSALGISGTHQHLSSICYIDSGAFNQMTFSSAHFSKIRPYTRNMQGHTNGGEKLPITIVGDVSHPLPLKNVFLYMQIFYLKRSDR